MTDPRNEPFDEACYRKIYNYADGSRDPAKVERDVANARREYEGIQAIARERQISWDAASPIWYDLEREAEWQAECDDIGLCAALEDGDGMDFDAPLISNPTPISAPSDDPREQALALLAAGKTHKEIADKLRVSTKTVQRMLKKSKKP